MDLELERLVFITAWHLGKVLVFTLRLARVIAAAKVQLRLLSFFCCMLCELNTKLFKRVFTWLFFFFTFCNHSRCAWHMLVSKILCFLTQLPVCSQHGPCKVNERKEFDVWVTHPLTNRFCVIKSFENNTIT